MVTPVVAARREARVCAFLFALSFFGYSLTHLCMVWLQVPSRFGTIPHRGAILVCAMIAVLGCLVGQRPSPWCRGIAPVALALFWALYTWTALREWTNPAPHLSELAPTYLAFGLGACFLPALGFFRRFTPESLRAARTAMIGMGLVVGGLLLLRSRTLFGTDFARYGGYGEMTALFVDFNPLHFAYLGSALLVLAVYAVLYGPWRGMRRLALVGALAGIGALLLLLGSGRGAVFAVLITASMAMAARLRRVRDLPRVVASLTVVAVIGYGFYEYGERTIGSDLIRRLEVVADGANVTSPAGRLALQSEAFEAFAQAPLIGYGLGLPSNGAYPHNYFIESLLATGLLGGSLFAVYALATLVASWRLLRSGHESAWVAMLAIHYFIAVQVSSGLATDSAFWLSSAAVLSTSQTVQQIVGVRDRQKIRSPQRRIVGVPPIRDLATG